MPYSITFAGAIMQFFVVVGLLTMEEAEQAKEGVVAVFSLILLLITLWGRIRAKFPVDMFGFRKEE